MICVPILNTLSILAKYSVHIKKSIRLPLHTLWDLCTEIRCQNSTGLDPLRFKLKRLRRQIIVQGWPWRNQYAGYKRVCRKILKWQCSRTPNFYVRLCLGSLQALTPSDSRLKDSEDKSNFQDIVTS